MARKPLFLLKRSVAWALGGAPHGPGQRIYRRPWIGGNTGPVPAFSALTARMGTTNDLVIVTFNDVPQNFSPIAGVAIEVDGVDDLNAAVAPVLNGNTLTYTLNSVAATDVDIRWVYSSPPGLISDGTDLAPSTSLLAQKKTISPTVGWQRADGTLWERADGTPWSRADGT